MLTIFDLISVEQVNEADVELACPEEVRAMLSRNGFSTDIVEPVSTIHTEPVTSVRSDPIASVRSASDIVLHMQTHGNAHTRKTYKGPQREFMAWMRSNDAFPLMSRETVTEEKLLIFLHTQVVGRKAKVQRKNTPEGVSQKVGIQTVRNYVSAAVNLWQQQTTASSNSFPNPRSHVIKRYLNFIQTKEFLRRRKNFEDREDKLVPWWMDTKTRIHSKVLSTRRLNAQQTNVLDTATAL
jgi:hypothetical protein